MRSVARILATASFLLACLACSKPEPPDKEQQPEPQASEPAEAVGDRGHGLAAFAGQGALDELHFVARLRR